MKHKTAIKPSGTPIHLIVLELAILLIEASLVTAEVVQRGATTLLEPGNLITAAITIFAVVMIFSTIILVIPEGKTSEVAHTFSKHSLLIGGTILIFTFGGYVGTVVEGERQEVYQSCCFSASFGFEGDQADADLNAWNLTSDPVAQVSLSNEISHTGDSSLRVRIAHFGEENDEIHTDVGFQSYLEGVARITSWVFVPRTEQTVGVEFWGSIIAIAYERDEEPMYIFSQEARIEPGEWTPLALGYTKEFQRGDQYIQWWGTVDSVHIRLRTMGSYQGSFYVDNIYVFR